MQTPLEAAIAAATQALASHQADTANLASVQSAIAAAQVRVNAGIERYNGALDNLAAAAAQAKVAIVA
jgi:hypothetical protein